MACFHPAIAYTKIPEIIDVWSKSQIIVSSQTTDWRWFSTVVERCDEYSGGLPKSQDDGSEARIERMAFSNTDPPRLFQTGVGPRLTPVVLVLLLHLDRYVV